MAPLLGVLLLAAAWSAYWFAAIAYAKQAVAGQRQEFARQGLTLTCAEEFWGGYPFRFEFTCPTPLISLRGGGHVTSGRLLAMALAYNPKQIVMLIDGPKTAFESPEQAFSILHGRAAAAVTFDKDWKASLSVEIPDVDIPRLLTAKKVMVFARPIEDQAIAVALSIGAFRWQRPDRPELLIDQGQLTGSLDKAMALNVQRIELSRGTVRYWGSGRIELDVLHRPSGELATETNDLNGLLDIIGPHLLMTVREKANLRMVLGLLGQKAKAGMTFSQGEFFIGPYKISNVVPLY